MWTVIGNLYACLVTRLVICHVKLRVVISIYPFVNLCLSCNLSCNLSCKLSFVSYQSVAFTIRIYICKGPL